jgi:orotate phosphoribosyltransferase
VIDREHEGRNNLENMGLTFMPLFTTSELKIAAGV